MKKKQRQRTPRRQKAEKKKKSRIDLQKQITGKKISLLAENIEPAALEQFQSAMSQAFSVAGVLLPDAHTGYTLPIGAVVGTDGVILPSWVGYDIGCGMCAVTTGLPADRLTPFSETIYRRIYEEIPTGFNHHDRPSAWNHNALEKTDTLQRLFERKGLKQLGTLGSGNHFIEIGHDEDDQIWIIVHSGSRGTGHAVASHYMRLASGDGKAREGHFGFEVQSENGQAYITDMNFCLAYALENRRRMIHRILEIIDRSIPDHPLDRLDLAGMINRNHNHAELAHGMWIHRKGATHAEEGMAGVIPGNMRDGSFIVEGLGNPESLWSSSHGAGRVLGRKKAKQTLSLEAFRESMAGIRAKITRGTLDESPFAYKNIFEVMKSQATLVSVRHHVKPIINIKA